jgi:hypothetical protein
LYVSYMFINVGFRLIYWMIMLSCSWRSKQDFMNIKKSIKG